MKYKALICDVDGTLIPNRPDGTPSEKVKEAIAKAKDTIHVGVATSRPYWMVKPILSHLELSGPCIINGATQIIEPMSEKILFEQSISQDSFQKAINIVVGFTPSFFVNEGKEDISYTPGLTLANPLNMYIHGLEPDDAEKLVSALSIIPDIHAHKIVGHIPNKLDVEVTHASATKQHGVVKVAELLGISPHEIIGVGDSYNDFPLLMACGLKVAMGNAVEDLKAIADYVAQSVDENGVAEVIEKFILNR